MELLCLEIPLLADLSNDYFQLDLYNHANAQRVTVNLFALFLRKYISRSKHGSNTQMYRMSWKKVSKMREVNALVRGHASYCKCMFVLPRIIRASINSKVAKMQSLLRCSSIELL
ncbi:Sialic acid transporter NanT [Dirofilaria immitis]